MLPHVVNHHALAPSFAELLADGARKNVGGAAGGEGHDQADGFAGIAALGLSLGLERKKANGRHKSCASCYLFESGAANWVSHDELTFTKLGAKRKISSCMARCVSVLGRWLLVAKLKRLVRPEIDVN
jgi:hypothetical protein